MELSKRLQAVADMVEPGSIVADVGCDHGYVSMYLVRKGICPRVLAMDVNRGPLERAKEHVEEAGLSSYIELRLSDGLKALGWKTCADLAGNGEMENTAVITGKVQDTGNCLQPEADTLLTAGLGGRLASRILEDSADKVRRMRWVILQPQSEIWLVRQTLRKMGYSITDENMIFEEGKFYTVIKARNERWEDRVRKEIPEKVCGSKTEGLENVCEQMPGIPKGLKISEAEWLEASDRFGAHLISGCHPILKDYLAEILRKNQFIGEKIKQEALSESTNQRLELLEKENSMLEKLISWMNGMCCRSEKMTF